MPIKSQILLSLRGGASFPFPWVGNGFRDLLLIHRLWQRWWYVTFGIRLPKIATSVLNMVSFSWVSYLEEASCHVRRIQINLQRGSHGEELSSLVNRQQKKFPEPTSLKRWSVGWSVGSIWGQWATRVMFIPPSCSCGYESPIMGWVNFNVFMSFASYSLLLSLWIASFHDPTQSIKSFLFCGNGLWVSKFRRVGFLLRNPNIVYIELLSSS